MPWPMSAVQTIVARPWADKNPAIDNRMIAPARSRVTLGFVLDQPLKRGLRFVPKIHRRSPLEVA